MNKIFSYSEIYKLKRDGFKGDLVYAEKVNNEMKDFTKLVESSEFSSELFKCPGCDPEFYIQMTMNCINKRPDAVFKVGKIGIIVFLHHDSNRMVTRTECHETARRIVPDLKEAIKGCLSFIDNLSLYELGHTPIISPPETKRKWSSDIYDKTRESYYYQQLRNNNYNQLYCGNIDYEQKQCEKLLLNNTNILDVKYADGSNSYMLEKYMPTYCVKAMHAITVDDPNIRGVQIIGNFYLNRALELGKEQEMAKRIVMSALATPYGIIEKIINYYKFKKN